MAQIPGDSNPLGYHIFGGYRVRGMRGYARQRAKHVHQMAKPGDLHPSTVGASEEFNEFGDCAFAWQARDIAQCEKLFSCGSPGHINAMGMGTGKTIATIAECLCIRDGIFDPPNTYAPCRDGAVAQNTKYNRLRNEINRIMADCATAGVEPPFTNAEAWIDRAWLDLCMGRLNTPDVQSLDFLCATMGEHELVNTWVRRHQRMFVHSRKATQRPESNCADLLILKRPPVLVVCGPTFATEWFEELEKLTPGSVRVLNLACDYGGAFKHARANYGHNGTRSLLHDIATMDYDFVFTTYGYLANAFSRSYSEKSVGLGSPPTNDSYPESATSGAAYSAREGGYSDVYVDPFVTSSGAAKQTFVVTTGSSNEFSAAGQKERADEAAAAAALKLSNKCALMSLLYSVVVVDEAHKICNSATIRHSGVRFAKAYFKIFITGTPIQNNINDLRSLMLALNFEHCLLHEIVFQQACNVRYQAQYERMRMQYVEQRVQHLVKTRETSHDHARATAFEEISSKVCQTIAQCTRAELQSMIGEAHRDKNPWKFRQLFIAIMSLRQLSSGGFATMWPDEADEMLPSSERSDQSVQPAYVYDDGSAVDPILRMVQWFFHWETQDTLQEHLVNFHCNRLARESLAASGALVNNTEYAPDFLATFENEARALLRVTHTTVKRPFMHDYEVAIYSSVCENTIALLNASPEELEAQFGSNNAADARAALRVPVLRMQQVCMHPALVFLPSGGTSTDEVQRVRAILNARIAGDEKALAREEKYCVSVPGIYSGAQNASPRGVAGCTTSGSPDDCQLDALALRKRLLVPYSMFSRVIDSERRIIRPSTKEIILYQLFTNQLPEMLEDKDPTRLVGPRTKILVFSTYPMIQVLHQRAADEAFGPDSSVCISGKVQPKHRDPLRHRFRNDPKVRVLFLTLETGAHGLNIPEADIVVFTDAWWNPAKELQAEYRARRPLRDHPIHVYHFLISHTIESYVIQRQNEKKELIETMMACDDPITNILQTNQRLRALQRFDAVAMRQVADDAIKSRRCINEQYARGFLEHMQSSSATGEQSRLNTGTEANSHESSSDERDMSGKRAAAGETPINNDMRVHLGSAAVDAHPDLARSDYQDAFCAFVRSMNTEVSDDSWFVTDDDAVDAQIATHTAKRTMRLPCSVEHGELSPTPPRTLGSDANECHGLADEHAVAHHTHEAVDQSFMEQLERDFFVCNETQSATPSSATSVLGKHPASNTTMLRTNKRRRRHELLDPQTLHSVTDRVT